MSPSRRGLSGLIAAVVVLIAAAGWWWTRAATFAIVPRADRNVQRVERGAGDLHHHLPRARHRAGGVLADQDSAIAVGVKTHGPHSLSFAICFEVEAYEKQ